MLHELLAEWTGLEPATPGVTGRYSNQLNYHSAAKFANKLKTILWRSGRDSNPRPPAWTGRYSNQLNYHSTEYCDVLLAEWTGLEPATPGVTGRYSNQLNYHSALIHFADIAWRSGRDSNPRPPA